MLKIISLLKSNSLLTNQQFIEYYEDHHAPLIESFIGKYLNGYCRNFTIDADDSVNVNTDALPRDFDAITELWFCTHANLVAATEVMQRQEVAQRIAADENIFLARDAVRSKRCPGPTLRV